MKRLIAQVLIGILLIVLALWAWQRADAEREARLLAERRAAVAESVQLYINEAFSTAASVVAVGEQPRIAQVLDAVVVRLQNAAPADAQAELYLRQWLARSYRKLELFDPAIEQISRVRAMLGTLHGQQSAQALSWDIELASVQIDRGRLLSAGDLLRPLIQRQDLPERLQVRFNTQLARGTLVTGEPAQAAEQLRLLLPRADALAESPAESAWQILQVLAIAEFQLGEFEQARVHLERLVAAKSDHYGHEHGEVLRSRSDLAIALDSLGRWEQAASMLRGVYDQATKLYGSDHIETVTTGQKLAKILIERDQRDEGAELLEQIAPVIASLRGDDHPQSLAVRGLQAAVDADSGKPRDAESKYRELIEIYDQNDSSKSPEALITRNNLARLLLKRGEFDQARELLFLVQEDARKAVGEEHYLWGIIASNYGEALLAADRAKGAIPVLQRSLRTLQRSFPADHERVLKATELLATAQAAVESG